MRHHDQHIRIWQNLLPEAEPGAAAARAVSGAGQGSCRGCPEDAASPAPSEVSGAGEPVWLCKAQVPSCCLCRASQPCCPSPATLGTSVSAAVTLGGCEVPHVHPLRLDRYCWIRGHSGKDGMPQEPQQSLRWELGLRQGPNPGGLLVCLPGAPASLAMSAPPHHHTHSVPLWALCSKGMCQAPPPASSPLVPSRASLGSDLAAAPGVWQALGQQPSARAPSQRCTPCGCCPSLPWDPGGNYSYFPK